MPNLAISLPVVTAGGTTYAFQLRRGIRYSNGTLVRASDFRRAFERSFRGRVPAGSPLVGADACKRRPRSCDLSRGIRTDDATGTIVFQPPAAGRASSCGLILVGADPARHAGPGHGDASGPLDGAVHDRELRAGTGAYARPQSLLPRVVEVARPDGFPDEIEFRLGGPHGVTAVERGRADVAIRFSRTTPRTSRRSRTSGRATRRRSTCTRSRRRSSSSSIRHNLHSTTSGCGGRSTTPSTAPLSSGSYGARSSPSRRVSPARRAPWASGATAPTPPPRAGRASGRRPTSTRARRLVAASGTRGMTRDGLDVPRLLGAGRSGAVRALEELGYRASIRRAEGLDAYIAKAATRRRGACRPE